MTARVVLGYVSGNVVTRCSPPGVDAISGPSSAMFWAADKRPTLIIQVGSVSLSAGGSQVVSWPYTLSGLPIVIGQSNPNPFHASGGSSTYNFISVSTTGAIIQSVGVSRVVRYAAVARRTA